MSYEANPMTLAPPSFIRQGHRNRNGTQFRLVSVKTYPLNDAYLVAGRLVQAPVNSGHQTGPADIVV